MIGYFHELCDFRYESTLLFFFVRLIFRMKLFCGCMPVVIMHAMSLEQQNNNNNNNHGHKNLIMIGPTTIKGIL